MALGRGQSNQREKPDLAVRVERFAVSEQIGLEIFVQLPPRDSEDSDFGGWNFEDMGFAHKREDLNRLPTGGFAAQRVYESVRDLSVCNRLRERFFGSGS